jgi:uncharacterized protein (DUF2141 family)
MNLKSINQNYMKATLSTLLLLILLTQQNTKNEISVGISGLKNQKGQVLIYLFSSETGFPTEFNSAFRSGKANISGTVSQFVFYDIPPGNYAIAIVHDENSDAKLGTNFIGIPSEGIGVSNNPKGSLGPPKFNEAVFSHQNGPTKISIKTNY